MKSADLYKQWTIEVSDDWGALGVMHLAGRGCRWQAPVDNRLLLLFVETNPKYPWTVYGGGDFSINVYLPREAPENPSKYQESVLESVAFFAYWSDEHRARLEDANRCVYEKLLNFDRDELYRKAADALNCTPEDARQQELVETSLEIMEMEVNEPSEAMINPSLFYYDADDVSMWANLVSEALPQALANICRKPEYAFGSSAG